MIYAGDQWIQLPTKDLYDTLMMAIAINAARDMYEKGQQEMKDFAKEYGDFLTPITADQDWYNQKVTGKVRDVVNALYAQGIDPLRNALGRAIIALTINNMPIGDIAKLRTSAANAQEYLKSRGDLVSKGLWNEDMERYALGGKTLETWDTSKNGIWSRQAPIKAQTMDDIIDPLVKDMDPIFDAELTARMNDGYNYSTVSRDRIRKVIDDNMPDLIGSGTAGGYYYNQALQAAGGNKDKAKEILKDWYADRASKRVQMKREADQYKLDTFRTKNDNWLDQQKSARDSYYGLITAGADSDGDGKISREERLNYATLMLNSRKYSGSRTQDGGENVFRRSERTIDSSAGADYIRSDADYENIQPKVSGVTHTINKDGSTYYTIPAGIAGSVLYQHDSVYDNESNRLIRYNEFAQKSGNYYFKPTGTMKAKKIIDSNGVEHMRYFIAGTLQHSDFESDITDGAGSPKIYEMEVTESVNKHGKNQQKK